MKEFAGSVLRLDADNMPVSSGNVAGRQTYCRMLANQRCAKLDVEGSWQTITLEQKDKSRGNKT